MRASARGPMWPWPWRRRGGSIATISCVHHCGRWRAVIGGDGIVASIAAASIVAKVTRDRLMAAMGAAHPGYGFERHMGYSVPEHCSALDRLGPTVHHRRSFSPVALALGASAADADEALPSVLPL
jgi:ribonuclease HII